MPTRPFLLSLACHGVLLGVLLVFAFLSPRPVPPGQVLSVSLETGIPSPAPPAPERPRPRTPEPPPEVAPRPDPPPPRRPVERPSPTPPPEPERPPEPEPEPRRPSLAELLGERLPDSPERPPDRPRPREISRLPDVPGISRPAEEASPPEPPGAEPEPEPGPEHPDGPVPEVSIEVTPGFTDNLYLSLLARRLTEGWALARSEAGLSLVRREVRVRFQVERSGAISEIVVTAPSGSIDFDRSARKVVGNAGPLRPLPAEWGLQVLRVTVRFRESGGPGARGG